MNFLEDKQFTYDEFLEVLKSENDDRNFHTMIVLVHKLQRPRFSIVEYDDFYRMVSVADAKFRDKMGDSRPSYF